MKFRFNESADFGLNKAIQYLTKHPESGMTREEVAKAEDYLRNIVAQIGPVVGEYPVWHPLVSHSCPSIQDYVHVNLKNTEKFDGLDHTVFFAHGFISCPYSRDSVNALIQSIKHLNNQFGYSIKYSQIPVMLYSKKVTPILVRTNQCYEINGDLTISKRSAAKLFIDKVFQSFDCRYSSGNWEDFSPCVLGTPSGGRSSLFVNQETGQILKTIFTTFVKQGLILTIP